jgi:16S rRNA (guanine527-N7)-methyltransferase
LTGVEVVVERAETYHPTQSFRTVISRAFSDLADFIRLASHLRARDGVMLAMKGLHPNEELAQLPPSWSADKILPLQIPQLDASRHLIFLQPSADIAD